MRTNVYVDAFNLYYGCLKGTAFRWLDLNAYCRLALPKNTINRIRYFTAKVSARPHDPQQPQRQETYLRALRTLPKLTIHLGHYLESAVYMRLAAPPAIGPSTVQVLKVEEKGSDVNLATYLLMDAFANEYDAAVVITNDSDLAEPIRLVRQRLRRNVVILHPCSLGGRSPSIQLKKVASKSLAIESAHRARAQFPSPLRDAVGVFHKPASW